jgi:hypothetical protein
LLVQTPATAQPFAFGRVASIKCNAGGNIVWIILEDKCHVSREGGGVVEGVVMRVCLACVLILSCVLLCCCCWLAGWSLADWVGFCWVFAWVFVGFLWFLMFLMVVVDIGWIW